MDREDDQRRGASPRQWQGRDTWILIVLVSLFIATRLLWLETNPRTSIYWEDSYRWAMVHELLDRPIWPLTEYQADHYQGGSLVMILLAMPSIALLGDSTLALKLPAVLISALVLALLFAIGRRYFERRTAILAALLHLAGPPLVAFWGLVVMGSHSESTLFSLGQFWMFLGPLADPRARPRVWGGFGALTGMGLWFCPTVGISTAACGLAALLQRPFPQARQLAAAVVGLIGGLTPWFLYNLSHDWVGMRRLLEIFGFRESIDPWLLQGPLEKLVALVSRDLAVGLFHPFDTPLPAPIATLILVAGSSTLALALAAALVRTGRFVAFGGLRSHATTQRDVETGREFVFLLYAGLWLAVILLSSFTVQPELGIVTYRLFVPAAVLFAIPAARSASLGLQRHGWAAAVTLAGCAALLTSSTVGSVALSQRIPDDSEKVHIEGGQLVRGLLLHRKYEDELWKARELGHRILGPRYRYLIFRGIGWGLEYRFENDGDLPYVERELQIFSASERAALLSGMRFALRLREKQVDLQLREVGGQRNLRLASRLQRLRVFVDAQWAVLPPVLKRLNTLR